MFGLVSLYHVSLRENEESILRLGVLATKSRGKRTGSYWVNEDMLVWAILHVSARHSVSVNEILIFVALMDTEETEVQRTARQGVFFVPDDVDVSYSMDVPLDVF
jgi:hypothetical protein